MREFRFLDDKRQATGLSWVEEQRWNELRQMLGLPDAPAYDAQMPQQEQYPQGYYAADGNWYPYPANYYGEGFDPAQGWGNAEQQQQQTWDQNGHYFDPNTQQWIPYAQQPWDPNQQQAQQYTGYEAYPEQQQWDPNQQQYAAWGYQQPQEPQYWPQQLPEAQPAPEQYPVATFDAPAEVAAELPVAPEATPELSVPELSLDDAPAALEGDVMEVSSEDVMLLDGESAQGSPFEQVAAVTTEAMPTFELEQAPVAEALPTFEVAPIEETPIAEAQPTFEAAAIEAQPTFEGAAIEEAPIADAQPTFEAAPIEEAPIADAQPTFEAAPIEEAPIADAQPTFEAAPIEEAPVVEAQPTVEETPSTFEAAPIEDALIAEAQSTFEVSTVEEKQSTIESAAVEETPVIESGPTFEATAVDEPPVVESQPTFEVTAAEAEAPTFEAAPIAEEPPTFEAAPIAEEPPTFDAAPIAEEPPAFEAAPIAEGPQTFELTTDEAPAEPKKPTLEIISDEQAAAEPQPTFELTSDEAPAAEPKKPTLEILSDEEAAAEPQPTFELTPEEPAPTFEILAAQREQPVVDNPPADPQLSRDTVPTVDLSIDDEPQPLAAAPTEPEAPVAHFGRDTVVTMELPAAEQAQPEPEPEAMIELAPEDQAPPEDQPTIELSADEQSFAIPEPELSGDAGEPVPLATNSDFVGMGSEQSWFGADLQSGTLADLAQENVNQGQAIEVDLSGDASETVPLATNSDFIDMPQLTSTGEHWSEQAAAVDPSLDPAAALQGAVESGADFLDGAEQPVAGSWPQQGWDYAADELPPQGDPQQQAWSDAQSAQTWEQHDAAQAEPTLDVAVDSEWEAAPAPSEPSVILSEELLAAPEPQPEPELEVTESEAELEPQELEVIEEEEEPAPVLLQQRTATPVSAPALASPVAVPMAGPGAIAMAQPGAPLPRISAAPLPEAPIAAPLPRASVDDLFDRAMSDLSGGGHNPSFIEGEHRVIIHTVEGQVKRGVIRDVDLFEGSIPLEQQVGFAPERIPSSRVKAIFFMQQQGGRTPNVSGDKVRITFNDGRQVAGFSSDYRSRDAGFFLVPADNRTNTARIFVYRSSVQSVIEG